MNSNRSKTQKKGVTDLSGSNFAANLHASTNTFVNFLNQEADDAYKRPWHRLERGLRLNRLRKFVDEEALRLTLTPPEKAALDTQIMKANDKKLLNSKNAVIYDADEQKIKEIMAGILLASPYTDDETKANPDEEATAWVAVIEEWRQFLGHCRNLKGCEVL